jgi:hypothetical protein
MSIPNQHQKKYEKSRPPDITICKVLACSPDVGQTLPADIVGLDSQGIYQFPYFQGFQNMVIKSFPCIVVIHPRRSWS